MERRIMERLKAYLEELKAEPEKWLEKKRNDFDYIKDNDNYCYFSGYVQAIEYALDFIRNEQTKEKRQ